MSLELEYCLSMDKLDVMSGYEKRIFKNIVKSPADLLKDNKMISNALKQCLSANTEMVLANGEIVNLPVAQDLIIELISYWKEHPEKIDLKVLSSVLGETRVEIDAGENASEVFKGFYSKKQEGQE